MILYSLQNLNFNIIKDQTDITKSELYNDKDFEGFKYAYGYLFSLLKSEAWIWCSGYPRIEHRYPYKQKSQLPKYRMWVLEVPDDKIICINREMWDSIINEDYSYNELWDFVTRLELKNCLKDTYKFINEFETLLEKHNISRFDTYSGLIKLDKSQWNTDYDDFLIPSPIKRKWVQSTTIIQDERFPMKI